MLSLLTLLLACGDKPEPEDTGTETTSKIQP